MKEFEFIKRLASGLDKPLSEIGIGDDAALSGGVLMAKDIMAEGVHFSSDAPLRNIIFRLFTANVSDIAAMGGRAKRVLLGFAKPSGLNSEELIQAVGRAAVFYGVEIVGGDTTSSKNGFFASLTVLGEPGGHVLRRSGAKAGDVLYLSRPVGGALELLEKELRGGKDFSHYLFEAETKLGSFLGEFGVSSCIDISDGLGRDAGHIAESSNVRIMIDHELIPMYPPERAVQSGEEFALLFTVPPGKAEELERGIHRSLGRPVHRIGKVLSGEGVYMGDKNVSLIGWEHS
ncbi:thiamine-phosphate kinase [Limisalsivibrio acetivorans]|uniref:thiamine-phosphate kinase n=1 Tax=Limisalsivibrio acetivorans TaxID=1304888 RepID=UPI0003B3DA7F|nr:thiamine-phosphate kinase [Limisalsivibrio acetivorans]